MVWSLSLWHPLVTCPLVWTELSNEEADDYLGTTPRGLLPCTAHQARLLVLVVVVVVVVLMTE